MLFPEKPSPDLLTKFKEYLSVNNPFHVIKQGEKCVPIQRISNPAEIERLAISFSTEPYCIIGARHGSPLGYFYICEISREASAKISELLCDDVHDIGRIVDSIFEVAPFHWNKKVEYIELESEISPEYYGLSIGKVHEHYRVHRI